MNAFPGSRIPLLKIKLADKGRIKDLREFVVRVDGLPACLNGQIVDMGEGVRGIIMGFTEREVLVLVLGDKSRLKPGLDVEGRNDPFRVPVGSGFIGRMVDSVGEPKDGGPAVVPEDWAPVFREPAAVWMRRPADGFLSTGVRIVDAVYPVAKGQRVLVLGDHGTGKTTLAIDAILNQRGRDCVCIYCSTGKPLVGVQRMASALQAGGAMEYTILVTEPDTAPPGEVYLVPFTAAAMGEFFAAQGRDVLVVFDDATRHALAYRQVALLLDRPPGREAYPGDIFYIQTQLMERAGAFSPSAGGGSMTFMVLAETIESDLSAYIPSSLASICDGRICFSSTAFGDGRRPALDHGLSAAVMGERVQPPALRSLSLCLRPVLAELLELGRIGRGQRGLSLAAESRLEWGRRLMTLMQQDERKPSPLAEQILLLFALEWGLLDRLDPHEVAAFRDGLYAFARERAKGLVGELERGAELSPGARDAATRLIGDFLAEVRPGGERT